MKFTPIPFAFFKSILFKQVVLESGKTVVEKISVPEVEAGEILEKLENAKLL